MNQANEACHRPIRCERCGRELVPGQGDFYVVRIEALADPTPPHFTEKDLDRDCQAEIERLLAAMRDLSAEEAMDQVYRQRIFYLCNPCCRDWMENPMG